MSAAQIADAAASGPVLVIGSPPPQGRDLDLLLEPDELETIAAALEREGFRPHEGAWARFADLSADVVELIPAASWELSEDALAALFDRAEPLAGFERLRVPAPHHQLLISATRFLGPSGRLKSSRAARLAPIAADEENWSRARAEAPAWGDVSALERLAAALRDEPRRELPATARGLTRRVRARGALIALSGIDGSGKSTQARALADSLDRLGVTAVIEWAPLAGDRWLDRIARPVKRVLARFSSLRPPPEPEEADPHRERGIVPNPGSELRRRVPVVGAAWATIVAFSNGFSHVRRSAPHLLAGRTVIFDRYELDSFVRLRFLYGEQRRFRIQRLLIRLLSPRPLVAFYIDIDAAISLARKDDKWSEEELDRQVRLYREECGGLAVRTLDGRRPADQLAAEIAEQVWRLLG